jgi:hypothetical protein
MHRRTPGGGTDPALTDGVRLYHLAAALSLALVATEAAAGVQVHVSSAAEVARDPAHTRTLRSELTRAFANVATPSETTLDVSLVRLSARHVGSEVEVRVEARAFLSDARGRVQWTSGASATARGRVRDKALVQRDALAAVADQLARHVRTRRK